MESPPPSKMRKRNSSADCGWDAPNVTNNVLVNGR
jgi:hypothetical protein